MKPQPVRPSYPSYPAPQQGKQLYPANEMDPFAVNGELISSRRELGGKTKAKEIDSRRCNANNRPHVFPFPALFSLFLSPSLLHTFTYSTLLIDTIYPHSILGDTCNRYTPPARLLLDSLDQFVFYFKRYPDPDTPIVPPSVHQHGGGKQTHQHQR
jgi:hypothetical protein